MMTELHALKTALALKTLEVKVGMKHTITSEMVTKLTQAVADPTMTNSEFTTLCSNLVGYAFPNAEITELYCAFYEYDKKKAA